MSDRMYPPGRWPLFGDGNHSDEGWKHHLKSHWEACGVPCEDEDDVEMRVMGCPCGRTVITACGKCGQPLIVVPMGMQETSERCEHYRELWSMGPTLGGQSK